MRTVINSYGSRILVLTLLAFPVRQLLAQSPSSCASVGSRANSNGQANNCPNVSGTAYASNFNGTIYATVPVLSKTGTLQFKYTGSNPSLSPFAITRVWLTNSGTTLQTIPFGPAGVPSISGGTTQVNYCFYGNNLPTVGTLSLELTDPQTGSVWGICSYDASCNTNCTVVATPGILPVEFVYFKAEQGTGQSVRLEWSTAQEEHNRGFIIERSAAGNTFDSIGWVPSSNPQGNSSMPASYTFSDMNLPDTSLFYRLRQVDIDGRSRYSFVVAIRTTDKTFPQCTIRCRNSELIISFPQSLPSVQHDISIYNTEGRLIRRANALGAVSTSVSGLAHKTIYFVSASDIQGNRIPARSIYMP
ncbi:MAG: hypothetical protein Q8932_13065 [Bacteroidota bacterium]|nr:hypothetical protein [Bacteroidota bacterium]